MLRERLYRNGLGWRRFSGKAIISSNVLLNLANGTFTRSSSGSYHNGSTSSIAWAEPNQPRYEDRGDGYGSLLLLEGSRTNLLLNSRNPSAVSWSAGTGQTTASVIAGPDGQTKASEANVASAQISNYQTVTQITGAYYAASAFGKAVSPPGAWQLLFTNANIATGSANHGGAWKRLDVVHSGTSTAGGLIPVDGRNWSAIGGIAANAANAYFDLAQVEAGAWPSSPIESGDSATTRAADLLTFANGTWSDEIRTTGFELDLYPAMSSGEFMSASVGTAAILDFYPGSGGAGVNGFGIRYAGGASIYFRMFSGGVQIVTPSISQKWERNQKITLRCEPITGRLSISGCVSGDGVYSGTAGTYPTGSLTVFSTHNGLTSMFGRISNLRKIN